MRFIAAFFEIWVGIYVINLIYPEKKKFRMLPVLAAAVMGYFLYQSRMEHYISPEMVLVYTMATGVVMAIVKIINSPRSQNLKGLHGVLSYCCRDAKTNQGGHKLISGVNCVPQFALQEFMNTKRLHKQNSGRMYYHMVQSFSP